MNDKNGLTVIAKVITQLVGPLAIIYGVYIVFHGHLTPGGGFAGGVMVASVFIMLSISHGYKFVEKKFSELGTVVVEGIGSLMFLFLALLGLVAAGTFFLNVLPKGTPLQIISAGIIPLCNIAVALKVSAGLFGAFIVLIFSRLFKGGEE